VQQANATSASDVIAVPAGRYQLTRRGSDDDSSAGDLDLGGRHNKTCGRAKYDLIILGAGSRTVIDGAGEDRVFDARRGRFALVSLVVTNGRTLSAGGGIRENAGSCVAALGLTVIRNRAALTGGGIFSPPGTDLDLRDSAVVDNEATWDGGGIEMAGAFSFGELTRTLTNVTITGNTTGSTGGGIDDFAAPAVLQNVTISGNEAEFDDTAIDFLTDGRFYPPPPSDMTVSSSVIDGTCSGAGFSLGGALASTGYNLETGTSCGFAMATDLQGTNPRLSAFQWRGTTPVLPLGAGSPAIDHGDPSRCPTHDQLGAPRVGACDAGAVEAHTPR